MKLSSLVVIAWLQFAPSAFGEPAPPVAKPADFSAALIEWQSLADAGDAEAQYSLGLMYANGIGVSQNAARASAWFSKASEQGHAKARDALADLSSNQKSFGYWVDAALRRTREAFSHYIELWKSGGRDELPDSSQRSPQLAELESRRIEFELRRDAETGSPETQYRLAMKYDQGHGVVQNFDQARRWYLKAAERGHAWAQFNLATMYQDGRGIPRNIAEAARWYAAAAQQGDAGSQNNLALMYLKGEGVMQNHAIAFDLFHKVAVSTSDPISQTNLGLMYENGWGVARDKSQALAWYRKAADQGFERAKDRLAELDLD